MSENSNKTFQNPKLHSFLHSVKLQDVGGGADLVSVSEAPEVPRAVHHHDPAVRPANQTHHVQQLQKSMDRDSSDELLCFWEISVVNYRVKRPNECCIFGGMKQGKYFNISINFKFNVKISGLARRHL